MSQQFSYTPGGSPEMDDLKDPHFYEEQRRNYPPGSPYGAPPYPPYFQQPPKKKWLAMLLSLMMPGTGQFYVGMMQRGLFIMMLVIMDIFAIVLFATRDEGTNVAMITLFSLILPVIYFYNVFEALQLTDIVNRRRFYGESEELTDPLQKLAKGGNLGILLIAAGGFLFLASSKPVWLESFFKLFGSYFGAIVLIIGGIALFVWETKRKQ
ncbi:hypothetical protein ACFVVQ_25985 [Paenibacillus chitinolyticus]|uniref:hypothetical protein n=1 Tax=Paenibacillus TaxID=44249 RepID=UPI001C2F5D63|nr:hypothetical protein [Paenibacillus sp. GbtcB18]